MERRLNRKESALFCRDADEILFIILFDERGIYLNEAGWARARRGNLRVRFNFRRAVESVAEKDSLPWVIEQEKEHPGFCRELWKALYVSGILQADVFARNNGGDPVICITKGNPGDEWRKIFPREIRGCSLLRAVEEINIIENNK